MSDRPTPRTDAQATGNSEATADEYEDMCQFARQLERELAVAREQLQQVIGAHEEMTLKARNLCEQRDRLAEAGRSMIDAGGNYCDLLIAQDKMLEALAAVEGGTDG